MSLLPRPAKRSARYPRVSRIGFYVKNPTTTQESTSSREIASHLTKTIRGTMEKWSGKGVRSIHYLPAQTITAILCVFSEQKYFNSMMPVFKDMFSDLSAEIGEDAVLTIDIEISKKVVEMFKNYETHNKGAIHDFVVEIVENPEIRQPSPLPGMIRPNPSPRTTSQFSLAPLTHSNFKPINEFKPLPAIVLSPASPNPTPNLLDLAPRSASDCAAPRKRPADEVEYGPSKATKRLDYESPKEPRENPWDLKSNHLEDLIKFLCKAKPWNQPLKYRDILPGEKPTSHHNKKKADENKHSDIAIAMTNIIPRISRRFDGLSTILSLEISDQHRSTLKKLIGYFHCTETGGVFTTLQWPNMNSLCYSLKAVAPFKKSFNAIEIHRRTMNIEEAVEGIAHYLESAICEGRSTLRSVAPMDLVNAYTVLKHNAPVATKTPAMELILEIIPLDDFSKFETTLHELASQLKECRAQALTRHCPFLNELGWGAGLLAMLYSVLGPLKHLDTEMEAENVLSTVMAFVNRRNDTYIKDLEPALLYGSRLTAFTTEIHNLCNKFNALKPTPPDLAGKFHDVDSNGRILKADGLPASMGMLKPPAGRENWLLPIPAEFLDTVPDPQTEAICQSMVSDEQRLIDAMLSDLGITNSPLIAHMHAGNARIKALLQADRPGLNLTSVLPPSASLPTAWFEPDVVFALADESDSMVE